MVNRVFTVHWRLPFITRQRPDMVSDNWMGRDL